MPKVTIQQLFEAGVHFGHQTRYWQPKMKPYIYGVSHKIHIIDLDKTLLLFEECLNYISSLAAKKGKILFVGTKPAAQDIISEEAKRCGMPYVNHRWLGGMLTNYKTIRQSIKRLKELEEMRDSPIFAKLTKKEALLTIREIEKLEKSLGGIKNMAGLPDALFVVDIGYESTAVNEALKLRIPIIGIVDTNNNPERIDHIIPGNDDSSRAIKLYASNIADVILEARGNIIEEVEIESKEMRKPQKKAMREKEHKKIVTKKQVVIHEESPEEGAKEIEKIVAEKEEGKKKSAVKAVKVVRKKPVKTVKHAKEAKEKKDTESKTKE
jgi:small subunit ribosomal protein S2